MRKKSKHVINQRRFFSKGVTLLELVVAITISLIPISVVGILLVGGQKNWKQSYNVANRKIETRAQAAISVFSDIGRQSERNSSQIYSLGGGAPILTLNASGIYLEQGEEMEFRYWGGSKLSKRAGGGTIDTFGLPTNYAYFYLDDDAIKVDYGSLSISGLRDKANKTVVLADNVVDIKFVRTIVNNVKQNNIVMKLTLKEDLLDPYSEKVTINTSTLMWN